MPEEKLSDSFLEDESQEEPPAGEMTAKRDFIIVQNEYRADIKKGDDLSDVPEKYHQNLKTEGVI